MKNVFKIFLCGAMIFAVTSVTVAGPTHDLSKTEFSKAKVFVPSVAILDAELPVVERVDFEILRVYPVDVNETKALEVILPTAHSPPR